MIYTVVQVFLWHVLFLILSIKMRLPRLCSQTYSCLVGVGEGHSALGLNFDLPLILVCLVELHFLKQLNGLISKTKKIGSL